MSSAKFSHRLRNHLLLRRRYAKLKLVAIKLKKRTLEQEKKIKELESSGGSGEFRSRACSLTSNFSVGQ